MEGIWEASRVGFVFLNDGGSVIVAQGIEATHEHFGHEVGTVDGFGSFFTFEKVKDGLGEEFEPAFEVLGCDGKAGVFGEGISSESWCAEEGGIPEAIHLLKVGLPVGNGCRKDGSDQFVMLD
ncbi:hypothetical protein N180_10920 [Pedobacter antarcticus 4BY]|uniref:Uncharacterized protein n=1 Tax=Pedobacter antarcticus 4BY TaxID=1358423 RepID=A0A081PLB8_9SPHI|nr:hypothetical protein N180_10920 [Pedobacter antarcticus 4BY]